MAQIKSLGKEDVPAGAVSRSGRPKKVRMTKSERRRNLTGWAFVLPAAALIVVMSFWPMVHAFFLSLQTGSPTRLHYAEPLWRNYTRLMQDPNFLLTMKTTFIYLIIQVPVMLCLAMALSVILNDPHLRFKGFWRTSIFLPCAVSLVSYSLVFRTLFADEGFVNVALKSLHIIDSDIHWLTETGPARAVIIIGLLWRWTGYNMVFYLAGLQNIDYSTIEAARIDGANSWQVFWRIIVPQLRPMILLTVIMSTNGTLQLFDESWNLTQGGPGSTTKSMSHYLYETAFRGNTNVGYASAISYVILILVAILAIIQMKVGDKRDA